MDTTADDADPVDYDEFGLFHENIAEFDLDVPVIPPVERIELESPHDAGRHVRALRWGTGDPEVVFVHGGAQNAHTWDTVALAIGRPALAVDLPGHGHSDWRPDGRYDPRTLADDIAPIISAHAPRAAAVVGMSLGGLTSLQLAAHHRHLVNRLVLVDITPGVNARKAKAVIDFVDGPQSFARFDDLLARTIEHNPTRSESSLRRGILHNARQLDDGSWQWRYDRSSHSRTRIEAAGGEAADDALSPMWDDLGSTTCPLTLVRGGTSPVVDDDDVAELLRRRPDATVVVVDGAGHSVQGDRPVELTAIVADVLDRSVPD